MEENTQKEKAEMENGMFAGLVLKGLSITCVKPSNTA